MKNTKTAENLIRAVARAILANRELEPKIEITERNGIMIAEIDAWPYNPAPMIGTGGTMKLALQTLLSGAMHPNSWSIVFRDRGGQDSARLRDVKPSVDAMEAVVKASVAHWKGMGHQAAGSVETSLSVVVGIVHVDESLRNAQRGAFSRIARALGKANGYGATCIIEKIK